MSKSWKMEVCVQGKWSSNAVAFKTEQEAIEAGRELLNRWFVPTDHRAVQSDQEPNYIFDFESYRPRPIPVSSEQFEKKE